MHRVELEPITSGQFLFLVRRKRIGGLLEIKHVYCDKLGMEVIDYTWVDPQTHLEIMYDKETYLRLARH